MLAERNYSYTLEEFEKMQKETNDKLEYFNGEIILHSKTSVRHNEVVLNIATALKNYFKGSKCKVYVEQIELLFHNEEDTVNVFPDVFVMCDNSELKGESFISIPKIIFEVVSENYRNNDYIKKLRLYQKYGVLEYVIVEQSGELIQYSLEDGCFKVQSDKHFKSNLFNNLEIKLEDIFD